MSGLAAADLRRALARYRVLLSATLAAGAVAAALSTVAPAPEQVSTVLTAARDLTSATPLVADDLVATELPSRLVPAGALLAPSEAVGRVVAGRVRQGETLTDVRLLGAGLLGAGRLGSSALPSASAVAVAVRVAEPATSLLVQAGDRVDVLSASPEGGATATVVASGLTVLSVPDVGPDSRDGALLVVRTERPTAARLAAAAVSGQLSVVLLPR